MTRFRRLALLALFALLVSGTSCGKKKDTDVGDPNRPPDSVIETDSDAKAEAKKRLVQIGLAMHNYESAMGGLPAGVVTQNGHLGLSWRVAILPYLEGDDAAALYHQFNLKEPWDSEQNKKLIAKMPRVYESPGKKAPEGKTHLRSFVGESAFIRLPRTGIVAKGKESPGPYPGFLPGTPARGLSLAHITDGSSNTIAVAEAAEPVEWTKPEDLPFPGFPGGPNPAPVPKLGGPFAGGFHVLMGDGATHFLPATLPEKVVRAMITVDGGEVLDKEASEILFPPKPKAAGPSTGVPADLPDASVRRAAVENYRTLVSGLHAFDEVHQYLPAAILADKAVGLSWRVQLLPYIGEDKLFKEFKLNEPWDSAHNKTLLERMPRVFASSGKAAPTGHTFIRTTMGQAGIIPWDLSAKPGKRGGPYTKGVPAIPMDRPPGSSLPGRRLIAGMPDGASNTVLFFEAAEAVPWTKPEELPFEMPAPVTGKFGRSEMPQDAKVPAVGGVFADGFHVAMADGRITFLKSGYPSGELAKLLCPNDGWVVDPLGPADMVGYSIPPEPTPAAPGKTPYERPPK